MCLISKFAVAKYFSLHHSTQPRRSKWVKIKGNVRGFQVSLLCTWLLTDKLFDFSHFFFSFCLSDLLRRPAAKHINKIPHKFWCCFSAIQSWLSIWTCSWSLPVFTSACFSFFFPLIIQCNFIHLIISLTSYPPPQKKNHLWVVEQITIYGGLVCLRFPQNWLSLANYIFVLFYTLMNVI